MKTYKGFTTDMKCRDFQYEEGKEYETDRAKACESGFHACEYPLDCFGYYSPYNSVYHEVEQDGDIDRNSKDSKVASTKIKIGARLSIAGMVQAAIDFTMSRIKPEAKADQDYGASSATGYKGASETFSATGLGVAWGYKGRAKGILGSYLVLADWEYIGDEEKDCYDRDNEDAWELKGAKMIHITGKKYKPDTWYTIKDGDVVEWGSEDEM